MAKFLEFSTEMFNNNIYKNSLFFVFILYFILIFNVINSDSNSLSESNNVLYLVAIIVPLLLFTYFIVSTMKDNRYLALLIIMTVVVLVVLFRSQLPSFERFLREFANSFTDVTELPPLSKEWSFGIAVTTKLLLLCISLLFITLIFNVFFENSYRQKSKTSIFLYAVFFIPCLISDYFKYLFNELKTTPKIVYTLLFIEIVLILLYIYLPKLFTKILFRKSNRIISDPIFLNKKVVVANADVFYNNTAENKLLEKQYNLKSPDEDENTPNKSLLRNYSVSFWLTMNKPNLGENEESMIFRVGEDNETSDEPDNPKYGSPYVSCIGSKLKVVFSNVIVIDGNDIEDVSVTIDIPYQRWNYFVFNYRDNKVDLFVNGNLIETVSLVDFLPVYSHSQVICTGSNTSRIHGAICELRVHSEHLGQNEIAQSYNLLKLKNPPVNNIY